jgi:hypothetical protein
VTVCDARSVTLCDRMAALEPLQSGSDIPDTTLRIDTRAQQPLAWRGKGVWAATSSLVVGIRFARPSPVGLRAGGFFPEACKDRDVTLLRDEHLPLYSLDRPSAEASRDVRFPPSPPSINPKPSRGQTSVLDV